MSEAIPVVLLIVPFLAALACFVIRSSACRSFIVIATAAGLAVSSLLLQGPLAPDAGLRWAGIIDPVITGGDFLLLAIMFFLGCRYRNFLIIMLTASQLGLFAWLEFFVFAEDQGHALFAVDILSLVLVRVVCLVGGLICLHAIPYMQAHEQHQNLARSRQPQFFAVLLLFLGAMNGLVLTNNLAHFYFFFELTTLCSFLLIAHDRTEEAVGNALTALWMNGLGGLLLLLAIWGLYSQSAQLDMGGLVAATAGNPAALLPLALLVLAACTKSAQLPWQKWLLGAMVAPTPTSALLHSSTMVKAGVYLALRFAPAFAHTLLAQGLMLAGGFTFFAAAALAIGQRNAKKVLAYSTISNLGLIFACAGIGTPGAVAAGILLILFHAVSKGLLFLCVGTAEQQVHSRDIEVMRGLCAQMPFTGMIAVLGMLTIIVPPFGMLLGKWLVFEAGADHVVFYLMLVLGSSFTLLYWVRLAGTLLASGQTTGFKPEIKPFLTRFPLAALGCGAVMLGLAAPILYGRLLVPLTSLFPVGRAFSAGQAGMLTTAVGSFPLIVVFAVAALIGLLALSGVSKAMVGRKGTAYMSGANTRLPDHFVGPLNRPVRAVVENAYLVPLFGEERWTLWVNLAATGLLFLMLGGALWK
ncbi:MAG: NADH-quinone oxidoreductase subunit L [Proteobacteria bacterium]|nr:NADH-quinone oxidoreductase subunit L [Pseudomonadota bacterium]MBU4294509.1 NADH-quinone oxidoreductase subunit L [Pseudomonadota bacterium]MCG2747045.1 NADH-quinone oxidoreductase subunit L [Desulfobulbaceae bacterium]